MAFPPESLDPYDPVSRSFYSRYVKPVISGPLELIGMPARGLGMLAEEATAALSGRPSRVKLTPQGATASQEGTLPFMGSLLYGGGAETPSLGRQAIEGYTGAARALGGAYDVGQPGGESPEERADWYKSHPYFSPVERGLTSLFETGLNIASDPVTWGWQAASAKAASEIAALKQATTASEGSRHLNEAMKALSTAQHDAAVVEGMRAIDAATPYVRATRLLAGALLPGMTEQAVEAGKGVVQAAQAGDVGAAAEAAGGLLGAGLGVYGTGRDVLSPSPLKAPRAAFEAERPAYISPGEALGKLYPERAAEVRAAGTGAEIPGQVGLTPREFTFAPEAMPAANREAVGTEGNFVTPAYITPSREIVVNPKAAVFADLPHEHVHEWGKRNPEKMAEILGSPEMQELAETTARERGLKKVPSSPRALEELLADAYRDSWAVRGRTPFDQFNLANWNKIKGVLGPIAAPRSPKFKGEVKPTEQGVPAPEGTQLSVRQAEPPTPEALPAEGRKAYEEAVPLGSQPPRIVRTQSGHVAVISTARNGNPYLVWTDKPVTKAQELEALSGLVNARQTGTDLATRIHAEAAHPDVPVSYFNSLSSELGLDTPEGQRRLGQVVAREFEGRAEADPLRDAGALDRIKADMKAQAYAENTGRELQKTNPAAYDFYLPRISAMFQAARGANYRKIKSEYVDVVASLARGERNRPVGPGIKDIPKDVTETVAGRVASELGAGTPEYVGEGSFNRVYKLGVATKGPHAGERLIARVGPERERLAPASEDWMLPVYERKSVDGLSVAISPETEDAVSHYGKLGGEPNAQVGEGAPTTRMGVDSATAQGLHLQEVDSLIERMLEEGKYVPLDVRDPNVRYAGGRPVVSDQGAVYPLSEWQRVKAGEQGALKPGDVIRASVREEKLDLTPGEAKEAAYWDKRERERLAGQTNEDRVVISLNEKLRAIPGDPDAIRLAVLGVSESKDRSDAFIEKTLRENIDSWAKDVDESLSPAELDEAVAEALPQFKEFIAETQKTPEGRDFLDGLAYEFSVRPEGVTGQERGDVGPLGFYSQLQRIVDSPQFPKSARASDYLSYLKNPQRQVKQAELYWTGAEDWLKSKGQDKVSREELAEFVRKNQVQVQEVEKSDSSKYEKWAEPGGQNYRELLLTLPGEERFAEGHYAEPNVLAHMRVNDRTDAQGKKVLFVEEIQSDWGQRGRELGFHDESSRVKSKRLRELLEKDFSDSELSPSEEAELASLEGLKAKIEPASFVTKTEDWTNLALKRIIQHAVQEGYDKVAWTTGEMQASRYDLSKHIDSLDVTYKPGSSTYAVAGYKDGRDILGKADIPEAELPTVVGKELAKKIVESPEVQQAKTGTELAFTPEQVRGMAPDVANHMLSLKKPANLTLKGLDLKIGGEGMKSYYDKIVPDLLGKIGKKFGANVERSEVPGLAGPVQSLAITPEMRQSLDQTGLPLFSFRPTEVQRDQIATKINELLGPNHKIDDPLAGFLGHMLADDPVAAAEGYRRLADPDFQKTLSRFKAMPYEKARTAAEETIARLWGEDPKQVQAALARMSRKGKVQPRETLVLAAFAQDAVEKYTSAQKALRAAETPEARAQAQLDLAVADAEVAAYTRPYLEQGTGLGRAMAMRSWLSRIPANSELYSLQAIERALKGVYGLDVEQARKMALELQSATPTERAEAWRRLQPKASWFYEAWRAGLLSSPATHIANVFGNAGRLAAYLAESPLATGLDAATHAVRGGDRSRYLAEGGQALKGMVQVWPSAFKKFLSDAGEALTLAPERNEAFIKQGKYEVRGAIPGWPGRAVRIPFRLLGAADDFFKVLFGSAELRRLGVREAHKAGAKDIGEFVDQFAREYEANQANGRYKLPGGKLVEEVTSAVEKMELEGTYQNELDSAGNAVMRFTRTFPLAQLFFPFVRTPWNIGKTTLKMSPLGLGYTLLHPKEFTRGEVMDRLALSLVGSTLMSTVAVGLKSGVLQLTGSGPADLNERKQLMETGWQPNSLKIGDTYYSYSRLEPISGLVGMVADMMEAGKEEKATSIAQKFIGAFVDNVNAKTYAQGLQNFAGLLNDPWVEGKQALRSTLGSFVPAGVAATARATDPYYREVGSDTLGQFVSGSLKSRIPGLSQTLPAKTSATGAPVERPGTPLSRGVWPIALSRERENPVLAEASRIHMVISPPSRRVRIPGGKGRPATPYDTQPDEFALLQQGHERATEEAARKIQSPYYQTLPDTIEEGGTRSKEAVLRSIFEKQRNRARNSLFSLLRRKGWRPGGNRPQAPAEPA